jgi:hypothetical protein
LASTIHIWHADAEKAFSSAGISVLNDKSLIIKWRRGRDSNPDLLVKRGYQRLSTLFLKHQALRDLNQMGRNLLNQRA